MSINSGSIFDGFLFLLRSRHENLFSDQRHRILTACHCEGASPKQSPHTEIASLAKALVRTSSRISYGNDNQRSRQFIYVFVTIQFTLITMKRKAKIVTIKLCSQL